MANQKSKIELLRRLEAEIAADENLPLRESNLVFGEGNPNTKVLFIGEAPGVNENEQRRPFVGRGGQLLNKMFEKIGWKREDIYITNIVKRRPPDNRDPEPEEIEAYKPYLSRQIQIINPPIIVTLGRFAMNYFLPNAKITRDQGKAFEMRGKLIVPFLHPAAALRGNEAMNLFQTTFEKLPALIKKWEARILKRKETFAESIEVVTEDMEQEKLF